MSCPPFVALPCGRTLARRIILALVLAFVLVWLVLLAYQFVAFKRAIDQNPSGLRQIGRTVAASLAQAADSAGAVAIVAASADQHNVLRREAGIWPGDLWFELYDRDGRLTHRTAAASIPAGMVGEVVERPIDGVAHWVFLQHTPHGALRVAEPKASDAALLALMAGSLVPYLLLAFPAALLPIVLAVNSGLRPLRRLAALVAARAPDDLSPIGVDPEYEELKPFVTAIEGLLDNLRGRLDAERELVQDAAHELKTPMAVIMTQAHVVSRTRDPEERRQAQLHLDHAVARASHLTQQLLELAALDASRQRDSRAVDVADFVRQIVAQSVHDALARQIDLSLDAPDALPLVLDVTALHSIVRNLLDNALRYGRAGGRIAVSLAVREGWLMLAVSDDGPGIPEADRERVFERFYRGRGHDAAGSGLGLAIVRQAATRMGGYVRLSAGPEGRGCSFEVGLPVIAAPRPQFPDTVSS